MNPKKFVLLSLLFPSVLLASKAQGPFLALDAENVSQLPKNFRTTNDALPFQKQVSVEGLKDLRMIGSGQFSDAMFQTVLKKLPQGISIMDVDLRQETHGFVNGNAISLYGIHNWANLGKLTHRIQIEEKEFIDQLKKTDQITVTKIDKKNLVQTRMQYVFPIKTAYSEEDLMKQYQMGYKRIYVLDHCKPSDEKVDQFIRMVRKLPKNTWLYFHCRAGVGRTTTFMGMYDMMHNAKKVSFEDILKRQQLMGGKDLLTIPKKHLKGEKTFKVACAKERADFLKSFYRYCVASQENGYAISWSDWLKKAQ